MRLKDTNMCDRVIEELCKMDGTYEDMARKIGCRTRTIKNWMYDNYTPSAYHLKGMYEAGLDVIYILTGRRTKND